MKAIVKTKSNFRQVNGVKLEVVECVGTRVTCKVPFYENEKLLKGVKMIAADFNINEVVELFTND